MKSLLVVSGVLLGFGLPQESEARLRAGQEKIKARDFDGAIPEFERALELNPDLFNARYGLGVCYWEKEDFARARGYFRAVVGQVEAIQPEAPLPAVHQKLLACALLLEDFEAGVGEATRLIGIQATGEYYYDRALAHQRRGEAPAALEDSARALKEEPLLTKARVLRAYALLAGGQAAEAMEEYATAVRLQPSDRRGFLGRAQAHYFQGHWSEALDDLERARKSNQGQGSDLEDQAATAALAWLVQVRLGRRDAAQAAVKPYQALLREAPRDPLQDHLLGTPLFLAGQIPEADFLRSAEAAKARKSQARCEAQFAAAERALLLGDAAAARRGFRACAETAGRGLFEYDLALRRLKELGP